MSDYLTDVLERLPRLAHADFAQIELRIMALRSGIDGAPPSPRPTWPEAYQLPADTSPTGRIIKRREDDYLREGIYHELRRRAIINSKSRPPVNAKFVMKSQQVRELLAAYTGDVSPAEQAALGQLSGQVLARYLDRSNIQVGVNTMLQNVDKVPTALDAAFPGYLTSGLLRFCWGRFK